MTTTKTLAALAAILAVAATILAACGGCVEVYERRAVTAENAEDYASAIRWWDRVVERRPDHVAAYFNRGVDKALMDDYRGAIADYSEVIERDSTHILALYNRGLNRYDLNEDALAVADFNAAIRIKGGDAEGNMPFAYFEITGSAPGHPFLNIEPDPRDVPFVDIRFYRGWAYYGLDSLRRAFQDFTFCIDRGYLLDESHFIRGEIYERYGMVDEAVQDYEFAVYYAWAGSGEYTEQATERLRILKDSK